jgi:cobalt-zinc-cadmium efflux system outer membrane protein
MLRLLLSIAAIVNAAMALGQIDTTIITINFENAKARLLKENVNLVAAYYDIDIAEAQARQAKLWNNPYFIWNQDIYSMEKNDYFNFKNQQLVQVEQIFSVAGKHTNTVKLAKINVDLNKMMAEDVLRSLMYELTQNYYQLMALQAKDSLFQKVLTQYAQQIKGAEKQLQVGVMSGNEVIRLKAEMLVIQSEAVANRGDMEQAMKSLKTLLNIDHPGRLVVREKNVDLRENPNLQGIIADALENRPDLRLSKRSVDYDAMNLRLQRSLSVPDIKFAYQPRDKGSNYVRPYQGFNIEVPLPLFDRNQGRIKAAKVQVEKSTQLAGLKELKVKNEVIASFNQLQQTYEGLNRFDPTFFQEAEELNKNSVFNFNKRNISLLEFLDQQRIYINTKTQYIEMLNQFLQAASQLNFTVGKEIIH